MCSTAASSQKCWHSVHSGVAYYLEHPAHRLEYLRNYSLPGCCMPGNLWYLRKVFRQEKNASEITSLWSLEEDNLSTHAEDPRITQPIGKGECKSFQLPDLSALPILTNFFPALLPTSSSSLGFTCPNFCLATPAFIYPPDEHKILHTSPTSSPCGHPYTPFLSFPNNWTFSEFFTAHRLHFFLYPHLPLPPVVKSLSSQNIRSFIPSALSSFFVFSWFCLQWPLAWAECQGHFHFPLEKTTHLM